jgi:hypothetical protein
MEYVTSTKVLAEGRMLLYYVYHGSGQSHLPEYVTCTKALAGAGEMLLQYTYHGSGQSSVAEYITCTRVLAGG